MRIGVAASGLGHVTRGIEAWAAYLGHALAARGEAVTLFRAAGQPTHPYERLVPCWTRSDARTLRLLRWLPRRVFWRLGLGSAYEIEQTTFALRLLPELRRGGVEVLHVKDPQVALLIQRAHALGLCPTRVILSHGTEEPLDFIRKIKYLHHLAPAHMDEARQAGVERPTWRMIPNFIDTDLFQPGDASGLRAQLGIPPTAAVVLCAAAIKSSHKRIDYLLTEFARLVQTDPDLPAWLVVAGGRGPDTDELLERGRRLLGDRVRFLVNHPSERMPELYRLADLFVLCSLKEMLGTALLEACASQVPCLVHRHPVMEWVIGPGGEALDMTQEGALASALGRLLREPARRQELGAQARTYCVETFSSERVVSQYLDYYHFVLTHDQPQRAARPVLAGDGDGR
jgi:glycosyltransferase involved in cell wall biosynthesis